MKKKRTNWSKVPWTPFVVCDIPDSQANRLDPPTFIVRNSRYQVTAYVRGNLPGYGDVVHLSLKVHDRSAHHDWRDLQRIKNELCGEECEAVELYPAESRLVDTANQYHLFVFRTYKFPFGFTTRLVAEGSWNGTAQRPFDADVKPADCLDDAGLQRVAAKAFKTGDDDANR